MLKLIYKAAQRRTELIEKGDNFLENELTFQQGVAPPHCVAPVHHF